MTLVVKNPCVSAGDAGDVGSIPESGRFPREGNGNPLQYSFLENPTDRGAWQVQSKGCKESDMTEHACKIPTSKLQPGGARFLKPYKMK